MDGEMTQWGEVLAAKTESSPQNPHGRPDFCRLSSDFHTGSMKWSHTFSLPSPLWSLSVYVSNSLSPPFKSKKKEERKEIRKRKREGKRKGRKKGKKEKKGERMEERREKHTLKYIYAKALNSNIDSVMYQYNF